MELRLEPNMAAPTVCCHLALTGRTARFFCTAGRGMERFVVREVKEKLEAEQVECILGKVFFTAEPDVSKLKRIKSGERLFLLLKKEPPLTLSSNRGKGFSEIKKCIIGEPHCWLAALSIWQNLHQTAKHETENQTSSKIPKRHSDTDHEPDVLKMFKKEHSLATENVCKGLQEYPNKSSHHNPTGENKLSVTVPVHSSEENLASSNSHQDFSFRVSCRCSGAVAKRYTSEELGRMIGIALIKQFGWKTELRAPDLEIFVHLNDDQSVVGFPLLRVPLANRAYIRNAGLRSTVAWAMASLAEICKAYYFGIDINESPLQAAYDNVRTAILEDRIGLLQASAKKLPLLSESVDIIISDIPFGKKFISIKEDFTDILHEMERVLRIGGTLVLLLSLELYKQAGLHVSGILNNARPPTAARGETSGGEMMTNVNYEERQGNSSNTSTESQSLRLRCLLPVESHSVSLGVTEACILKCKKIATPPVQ
ncbi:U6 snRNA (guanine-N(2))-methyltransferase THUMPD2 isoform X2 [Lissotriton helveticus]